MCIHVRVLDPACQNINTELQCYVLDRNCTAYSNAVESEESSGQNNVLYNISILGGVLVLIACLIIIMLCFKWRKNMRTESKFYKMHDLVYTIDDINQTCPIQGV